MIKMFIVLVLSMSCTRHGAIPPALYTKPPECKVSYQESKNINPTLFVLIKQGECKNPDTIFGLRFTF